MESVVGKWSLLRASGTDGQGLEIPSLPLPVGTAAGPLRLALGSGGEARLLIPLQQGFIPPDFEPGPALRIGVSTLMHRGVACRFLDLVCLSAEVENVFGDLVDEVLARIGAGCEVSEALSGAIEDFRLLLVPEPSRAPERKRIAGLIAELVVLNRLLDISEDGWRAWLGPTGDRHDFRKRDTSLEVKASLRAGSSIITINGLMQLDPPSNGRLFLFHCVLEPAEGGLLSIAALGQHAITRSSDPGEVRARLESVGCNDVFDPAWNSVSFRLEAEQLYAVSANFPRIAPSSFPEGQLPPGLVEATYQIDLAFAADCRLSSAEGGTVLRELA